MAGLLTFPVSMKVAGRRIVIAGGNIEAVRKARLTVKTEAEVVVVAEHFDAGFADLPVSRIEGKLTAEHLDDAALLFVALPEGEAATAVELARAAGVPVNVIDQPEMCDFFTPAIVERAPVAVAVSSDGEAPVLARLIRARIEAILPVALGQIAGLAGKLRDRVESVLSDGEARRHYYERVVTSPTVEAELERGNFGAAHDEALRLLDSEASNEVRPGHVWLVGAGPGAEDLLTLRAQRLLQEADVIVHDQLVPDAVVQMGRRDATRIAVGKAKGKHSITQPKINDKLVSLARQGRRVVRLKSGDPMIFGRAGEEIVALREAGIGFSIVPGVTAALAAAADTQLPVTLREVASGFVLATAHGADNADLKHWAGLAKAGLTLGIYMGKTVTAEIAGKLSAEGLDAATPVGIVVNAGRMGAALFSGSVSDLARGQLAFPAGPALVFIGPAVAQGDWSRSQPIAELTELFA